MTIKIKYSEEERNLIFTTLVNIIERNEKRSLDQSDKILHSILLGVGEKFTSKLSSTKKQHSIKLKYHQAWALVQFCLLTTQQYDEYSDILFQGIIARLAPKL